MSSRTDADVYLELDDGETLTTAELNLIGDAITAVISKKISLHTNIDIAPVTTWGEPTYTSEVDLSILKRISHINVVSKYSTLQDVKHIFNPKTADQYIDGEYLDEEEP